MLNFVFRERIKEMIKIGNYWIGPAEFEDNLENIPGFYLKPDTSQKFDYIFCIIRNA